MFETVAIFLTLSLLFKSVTSTSLSPLHQQLGWITVILLIICAYLCHIYNRICNIKNMLEENTTVVKSIDFYNKPKEIQEAIMKAERQKAETIASKSKHENIIIIATTIILGIISLVIFAFQFNSQFSKDEPVKQNNESYIKFNNTHIPAKNMYE